MAARTKTTATDQSQPATPDVPEPLVDLDDIAPSKPTVRYGGKLYEMRTLDDFGIEKQQQLTRDGREFFRLWSADDELNKKQRERLKMLLERMFDQVFDAPAAVKQELSDGKKAQVVLGFTLAPLAQRQAQMQMAEPPDSLPTTES